MFEAACLACFMGFLVFFTGYVLLVLFSGRFQISSTQLQLLLPIVARLSLAHLAFFLLVLSRYCFQFSNLSPKLFIYSSGRLAEVHEAPSSSSSSSAAPPSSRLSGIKNCIASEEFRIICTYMSKKNVLSYHISHFSYLFFHFAFAENPSSAKNRLIIDDLSCHKHKTRHTSRPLSSSDEECQESVRLFREEKMGRTFKCVDEKFLKYFVVPARSTLQSSSPAWSMCIMRVKMMFTWKHFFFRW